MRFHHLVVRYTYFSIIYANGDNDNKGNGVHKKSTVEFKSVPFAATYCDGRYFARVKFQIVDFSYYAILVPIFSQQFKAGYLTR